MHELEKLIRAMEADLEGIKNNMVSGRYENIRDYDRVVGEAKMLTKILREARILMGEREDDDDASDG